MTVCKNATPKGNKVCDLYVCICSNMNDEKALIFLFNDQGDNAEVNTMYGNLSLICAIASGPLSFRSSTFSSLLGNSI